jgi:hypothetical protein
MPAEQWPRSRVYYFCSNCRDVCGIPKANPADCPQCGRKGLKDIFSEIAERLGQSADLTRQHHLQLARKFHYYPQ